MRVLNEEQFAAAKSHGVPPVDEVREGLFAVPVPMPGNFLSYTLSLVQCQPGGVTIIDPGSASDTALELFDGVLRTQGRGVHEVNTIIITHGHPDHLGNAEALRTATGAAVLMSKREEQDLSEPKVGALELQQHFAAWGAPATALPEEIRYEPATPFLADAYLTDGELVPGTGWRAVATPGHTAGHMCLVDEARQLIATGDHVLPTVNPGIGLSGARNDENAAANFINSLERIALYDDYEVLPGHGYRFQGLRSRRQAQQQHVLKRWAEVREVLTRTPDASVWEIAQQLSWSAGWAKLSASPLLVTALAQTAMYRDAVRLNLIEPQAQPAQ